MQGTFLAAGMSHTCAIFGAGAVRCWGDNTRGQLGRSPVGDPLATYSVDLGKDQKAAAIYAGPNHTCVILDGGAVKCWGDNSFGQLGLGDMANRGDGTLAMGDGLPVVDLGTGERAAALALGGTASCALLGDGRLKCWGDPYQGATGHGDLDVRGASPGTMGDNLPDVDLGSRDGQRLKVKRVEAFEYHSFCAILEDTGPDNSALKCWGSNDYCELGIGSHDGGRGAVPETIGDHLEWIDIGTTAAGAARKAVALAGGYQSMCVLGDDGVVKCWGTNGSGELGIGTTSDPRSCSPDEMGNAGLVALDAPGVAIGARHEHACALLATGAVTCWGGNGSGQLGTGDTMTRTSPSAPLAFDDGFVPSGLVLGDDHSCAMTAAGRAKCWGSDAQGQLGPPVTGDLHAPGPDLRLRGRPVQTIAGGGDHTCAIFQDGRLSCWGRNSEGQLGLGDVINRGDGPGQMGDALPTVDLGPGASAIAVAAGRAHTCAVLATGEVTCWGAGGAGQLGQGTQAALLAPAAPVALPKAATAVATGDDFSCALLSDGRVICWGEGARGQLGTGDAAGRLTPAPVVGLADKALEIVAGDHHACARLENHQLACWGANDRGQLGIGDTADRMKPASVTPGGHRPISVSARGDATCALLDDGEIKCWGANDRGQLGLGDAMDRLVPGAAVDLGTGHSSAALSLGGAFTCALLGTQQAKCWGDNRSNQLGAPLRGPAYGDDPNETGDFLAAAVQGGGRSVRAIAAGGAHACVLLDTADVRCWGDNTYGQLGVGDPGIHSSLSNPAGAVDLGSP